MANEDVNEAAERLLETTREYYLTVVDHTVGLQERNVRFAQGLAEGWIQELRRQSEMNWEMAEELVEQAEKQRDAVWELVEESIDTYTGFLYAPFSSYKEGPEAAKKATTG
jgi:nicotinamidase-related amidase